MWRKKKDISSGKQGFIYAERDSVCMGDDCTAPNPGNLAYQDDMMLSEFIPVIMKYLPAMTNCRWIIYFGEDKTAVLVAGSDKKYSCELLTADRKIKELADREIFCKYEPQLV